MRVRCILTTTFLACVALLTTRTAVAAPQDPRLETTLWIADHLPTRFVSLEKTGSHRQDNNYFAGPCTIIAITNNYAHVLVGALAQGEPKQTVTVLRLRPSTGYRIAARQRDLQKSELPVGRRSSDDSGFRVTYTLDLRHLDPGHIEIEQKTDDALWLTVGSSTDGDWIEFPFYKVNASIVPRLAAAFRHGIAACGGKADPF